MLLITDTGIGMDKDTLHKVIQGNYTSTGSGIGISSIKKSVAILNGTFHMESTVGEGTSTEITIPIKLCKLFLSEKTTTHECSMCLGNPALESSFFEEKISWWLKNKNIAVIDDIDINCEIVKSILLSLGAVNVTIFNTSEEIESFKDSANSFNMAFIDMNLFPDNHLTGADICKLMTAESIKVLVSGSNANSSGFSAVLNKPLSVADMRNCIYGLIRIEQDKSL